MGRNMEKYCLKWNEFEANIRESFKTLREEKRLFDVTLVTDDGQHIQAHKMVLSAGSKFFSDIFRKTNYSNMLIYLKGVSSAELEPITEFLYNGEAFITQEYLTHFLGTAKELQIKGLLGYLDGMGQNTAENGNSTQRNTKYNEFETEAKGYKNTDDQQGTFLSLEEVANFSGTGDGTVVKRDNNNSVCNANRELDLQIAGMCEKNEGL